MLMPIRLINPKRVWHRWHDTWCVYQQCHSNRICVANVYLTHPHLAQTQASSCMALTLFIRVWCVKRAPHQTPTHLRRKASLAFSSKKTGLPTQALVFTSSYNCLKCFEVCVCSITICGQFLAYTSTCGDQPVGYVWGQNTISGLGVRFRTKMWKKV